MEIDLGARAVAGLARKECENCGIKFTPKKPHHKYCSDCATIMWERGEEAAALEGEKY